MKDNYFTLVKMKNGYWYYWVYQDGTRIRRSTGERKRSEALLVIHERLLKDNLLNEKRKKTDLTFSEFAEPFWAPETCPILKDKVLRGGRYSKQRAKTFWLNTRKYLFPTFGALRLSNITPDMVNSWLLSLPGSFGIAPQTANKQLSMFRQMMNIAMAQKHVLANPCATIKPLVPKPKSRGCFTSEQIRTLFSSPWDNSYLKLACRLAAMTGMRAGEVRGLQKDDIKRDHILLCRSWVEKDGLKTTKSGKPRIVPITPELREQLLSVPNNGPYVFSLSGKKPLCQTLFIKGLQDHMAKCGMDYKAERLSFHSFRHFFNTRLLSAGVEGIKIRAVIGHESEEMTEHYAHLSAEDMRQILLIQKQIEAM